VALILGAIGAAYLYQHVEALSGVQALPLPAALGEVGRQLLAGLVLIVIALALFAAVDVPLQLFLHSQRLRMSHQEVKQEHKEIEGNQEVKSKMKVRMREMANRRMLAAVPKADLVVMNPTHYAVALKYDEATMAAPRVVAKGADLMALRIRDAAKTAQVPVLQAAPLARALYAHAEVDREVPLALYSAVAQVLAYVYRLRAALSGRTPLPGELPAIAVPDELDPHHPASKRSAEA
jgi:flagellar biosynthetic protein FlhB